MSNRFFIALTLSGVLHAAMFAATSGMHQWLLAGLAHARDPQTLTVSVVSVRGMSTEAAAPSHRSHPSHPESRHLGATVPARKSPATPLVARRNIDAPPDTASAKPVHAPPLQDKPDRSVANAKQEPTPAPDLPDTDDLPARSPTGGQQAVASTAAPGNPGDSAPEGAGGRAAERTYLAEFLAALSRYKHYPQSARLRRQEGRVVVALVLKNDGTINDVQIKEPSRFPLLNRAALRSVRQLDRFKPFPAGMDRSAWQLSVPFQYAIRDP